jgi:hypothetical protein
MNKQIQSSIDDVRFKARLHYYENKRGLPHDEAVMRAKGGQAAPTNNEEKPMSKWAIRKAEREAREEAKKAHPLGLNECPFCKAAFFRKLNGKYEPIPMDHCCGFNFYFTKRLEGEQK